MSKHQKIEPVLVDRISHARDTVHKVSEFMTIQEMLLFRRCSKASLFNVDRLKHSVSQRVRKMLEQRLQVPQALIDLVHQLDGVFSGSTLLSCIYNDFQLEKDEKKNHESDIDIFIPMSTKSKVQEWFATQENCNWKFMSCAFNWEDYTESDIEDHPDFREAKEGPLPHYPVYGICNAVAKEPDSLLRTLQFVFLRHMAPREYIDNSFDISLVKNWFDGKRLCIGVQKDIVDKTFSYRAQDYVRNRICFDLPTHRIKKYETYGFKCKNPITTTQLIRSSGEEYTFEAFTVDGCTFNLNIFVTRNGIRGKVWLFDQEGLNFFIATARELGMPFSVDYATRYSTSDWLKQNQMRRYYNA